MSNDYALVLECEGLTNDLSVDNLHIFVNEKYGTLTPFVQNILTVTLQLAMNGARSGRGSFAKLTVGSNRKSINWERHYKIAAAELLSIIHSGSFVDDKGDLIYKCWPIITGVALDEVSEYHVSMKISFNDLINKVSLVR